MRYMLQHPQIAGLAGEPDDLFEKAVEQVLQYDRASAALIQRRLAIGYARATRLLDQLEAAGVVGPAEGSSAREVLIRSMEEYEEKAGKPPKKEEEHVYNFPINYKVPTNLKIEKAKSIPWSRQFADILETDEFKKRKTEYPIILGYDDQDKIHIENLLDVGNLIIAGNTQSQKENLLDTILLTYLLRYTPWDLRLILIDETHYLDLYNGIPHLLSPVINEYDKVIAAFRWSWSETQRRLKKFTQAGVRDLASYDKVSGVEKEPPILFITNIPYFYDEVTDSLTVITEQGVRVGIHNIVVVNRANGDSLPRNIKSNIPARVVFRMTSAGESKAIDVSGAEKLEPGEIIYKPNYGETAKLRAIFTPEVNVKEVVEAVKSSASHS